MSFKQVTRAASVSIAAFLAGPLTAEAQSGADDPGAQRALEEVVVTARKREESLYDTPISVTMISADSIDRLAADSLNDLNAVTPNVSVAENGTINIRGIQSNARNVGFEAGVSIFIDGVYLGRPALNNQDLLDVQQIEVLRGPQGTLYGKNTTAGAINITTLRPTDEFVMKALAEFGENNRLRGGAVVAGPIAESLVSGKLSAYAGKSDGYIKNRFNGQESGTDDYYGFRGELRIQPSDRLDIALRADWVVNKSIPPRVTAELSEGSDGIYFGVVSPGVIGPIDVSAFVEGNSKTLANEDVVLIADREGGGASLTFDYELSGGGMLTSISAFRTQDVFSQSDDDFTPGDMVWHTWDDSVRHWTQELRLSSSPDGRFRYVVGAYALRQKAESAVPITLGTNFVLNALIGRTISVFRNDSVVETEAYSFFANADYDITDRLTANLGVRYTHEGKEIDFVQVGVPMMFPDLTVVEDFTDTDLSPTVSLTYKPSDSASVYATVSRGFKSGGWNPDITATDQIRFDSESVTNYEVGTHLGLLDGSLQINASIYRMDYKDLQISQFLSTALGRVIRNAGEVEIDGVEVDLTSKLTNWLTLAAGVGYNDAVFTEYDDLAGGVYTGNQVHGSPKWSAFAAGDIRYPLGSLGDLIARAEYSYRSRVYFTPSQDRALSTDPYGLVNARVGLSLMDGRVEVIAFGENLTDEEPQLDAYDQQVGVPVFVRLHGEGRRFGMRFTYRY